jgi:LmbE family N-acetylglucosaminyl deacetylase
METVVQYIFISPHLDDAILSCGGIIHSLNSSGHIVEIWTIFAGLPENILFTNFAKSLHQRWNLADQNPIKYRREEDKNACKILGAKYKYFNYFDCIYRYMEDGQPLVTKEEDLFQDVIGNQLLLVKEIANSIFKKLPENAILISPLAIGKHIDHQIVKMALISKSIAKLRFYADYPYVVKESSKFDPTYKGDLQEESILLMKIDQEKWKLAVSAYQSQISTFWNGNIEMFQKIDDYVSSGGGKKLWKIPIRK